MNMKITSLCCFTLTNTNIKLKKRLNSSRVHDFAQVFFLFPYNDEKFIVVCKCYNQVSIMNEFTSKLGYEMTKSIEVLFEIQLSTC